MKTIPWWTLSAAGAGPVLLIGGFIGAAALQPASYTPVRDTISELAKQGATDAWVMTAALVGLGCCYLLVAIGLHPARTAGRLVLACGGAATLSIAGFRQPSHGYSPGHEVAVIAAALTACTWSLFASYRGHPAWLLRRTPCVAATAVLLGLASWYALEGHGALLGIAERCAAAGPALWVLAVAVSASARTPLRGPNAAA